MPALTCQRFSPADRRLGVVAVDRSASPAGMKSDSATSVFSCGKHLEVLTGVLKYARRICRKIFDAIDYYATRHLRVADSTRGERPTAFDSPMSVGKLEEASERPHYNWAETRQLAACCLMQLAYTSFKPARFRSAARPETAGAVRARSMAASKVQRPITPPAASPFATADHAPAGWTCRCCRVRVPRWSSHCAPIPGSTSLPRSATAARR